MSEASSLTAITILHEAYGEDIELYDEQGEAIVFKLLAEFAARGRQYAVLQSQELKKDEEVALFRITSAGDGEYELETIEDDDEWEDISELYDEWVFPNDPEV